MTTRQRITDSGGSSVTIKSEVPRTLYTIVQRYAIRMGITEIQSWRFILTQISDEIEANRFGFLGTTIGKVVHDLQLDNKIGPPGMSPIDFSKLHQSTKLKSGFVGVYANGQGFRALARKIGGGSEHIGTYPTAEQAAWMRYLHYQKTQLPYGNEEGEYEELLKELNDLVKAFPMLDADGIIWNEDGMRAIGGQPTLTSLLIKYKIKFGTFDGATDKPRPVEMFPESMTNRQLTDEQREAARQAAEAAVDGLVD